MGQKYIKLNCPSLVNVLQVLMCSIYNHIHSKLVSKGVIMLTSLTGFGHLTRYWLKVL